MIFFSYTNILIINIQHLINEIYLMFCIYHACYLFKVVLILQNLLANENNDL